MDYKLMIPIFILQLILVVFSLYDLIRREKTRVKGGNKWIWGLVIILINFIGPIVYLIFGRKD